MAKRDERKPIHVPLSIRILITGCGLMGITAAALFVLFRSENGSLFRNANAQTAYLSAHEISMALPVTQAPATSTPFETEAPADSPCPTDPAITYSTYSTLQLGDDNPAVSALQERLMSLGYMDHDEPNTVFQVSTQNAVILFQRASDLPQTGIATNALQELLFSEDAQEYRVKQSDSGSDIRSIQLRLKDLGYYSDKTTGYFGPKTMDAVASFQRMNRVPADGEINREDWEILYSGDAVPAGGTPSPTPKETPTPKPTQKTTPKPTPKPTNKPTDKPTNKPTSSSVTDRPTETPTSSVTATPYIPEEGVPTEKPTEKPTEIPQEPDEDQVEKLVGTALSQIGDPYVWGDEGPDSFDCSGLVYYCLRKSGVKIGRWNAKNYSRNDDWEKITDMDDLKRGDLLFFRSDDEDEVNHTAIYLGGGDFVHASSSKGQVLKTSFSSYWRRNFVCGRRVF